MATKYADPDFTVTPVRDDDTIWFPGHQHELEVILDFESARLSTAQLHIAMDMLGYRNRIRRNVVDTLYMIPRGMASYLFKNDRVANKVANSICA